MHRNTIILLAVLAVIASLLIGFKVGQGLKIIPTASPIPTPVVQVLPTPLLKSHTHAGCGLKFDYPPSLTLTEASDSAQLTQTGSDERIVLICGVDFPKPPLPPERIEEATVAGQVATLYHDASAKDGTPIDVYVFTNPKNKLEIGLFGFGSVFEELIKSIEIL